jgi:2-phosphoglycerate kinase
MSEQSTAPSPLDTPSDYLALYPKLWRALGYPSERRPIMIGIDGRAGKGKTSLASWIGWQFNMPTIHLDLFLVPGRGRAEWELTGLQRVIEARLKRQKPALVEGVLLLDALTSLSLKPDFMIFVGPDNQENDPSDLQSQINEYLQRERPASRADFNVKWTPPFER